MHPTTQQYRNAIYAPTRKVTGRVTFDISDVTAIGDITDITTSAQSSISNKQQLANKVRQSSANLATWETDRFRLDGSFSFPDDEIENNGEMGFVSANLCAADGVFALYPAITFAFGNPHSSAGLTITFDTINNEYASDFDVTAYDGANNVIDSVSVVGNTKVIADPLGQLAGYRKIEITIKKWSVGHRRARVLEVDFGIVRVYNDDTLIRMGLIEEIDPITAQLPAPEFDFTVDNSGREFNILNPTGFYKFLQERQHIYAELGVELGRGMVEWVPIGNYLLYEWRSDEGALTATFTARTALDLMNNYDYEQLTSVPRTLYDLAENVFATCGIANYSIDPALQAITTNSLAKKTNCKNALQMIAIAGRCHIFVTRNSTITLKQFSMDAANDAITFDNIYREPQIELEPVVKQVEVTYWSDLETAVNVVATSSVTAGEVLRLEHNTLINTSAQALMVANWIMAQKNYRAKYRVNWRGNPAHELSDVVDIENTFGGNMRAFLTKRHMTYQGYLRGQTEAHGKVN